MTEATDGSRTALLRSSTSRCVAASLTGILCMLAAFAAAFFTRVPNSDLYMTLAGGRDAAEGKIGRSDDWSYITANAETIVVPVNSEPAGAAAAQPHTRASGARVWINQSWLTGRVLYGLWLQFGESGLLFARGALLVAMTFALIAYLRGRHDSWPAVLFSAAAFLIAARYFLLLRGNLVTMTLVPVTLCVLQSSQRRAWCALMLAPIFAMWGNAHGGYLFGVAVCGAWCGWRLVHWLLTREDNSLRTVFVVVGAVATGLLATWALSPFGTRIFTEPFAMSESSTWREIRDWWPLVMSPAFLERLYGSVVNDSPWTYLMREMAQNFRETGVFFIVVPTAVALWLAGLIRVRVSRIRSAKQESARHATNADGPKCCNGLADTGYCLTLLIATVFMAVTGRRFVPLAMMMALPLMSAGLDMLWCSAAGRVGRSAFAIGSLGMAVLVSVLYPIVLLGYSNEHPQIGVETLLDRHIAASAQPVSAARFMRENGITGNIYHSYNNEALIRWSVPGARVGVGGRAQLMYTEAEYSDLHQYDGTDSPRPGDIERFRHDYLDKYKIDAALFALKQWGWILQLMDTAEWVPVHLDERYCLLVRATAERLPLITPILSGDGVVIDEPSLMPVSSLDSNVAISSTSSAPASGQVVRFIDRATYLRTRALLMTSPAFRTAEQTPQAQMERFRKRLEAIDLALSVEPYGALYTLVMKIDPTAGAATGDLILQYFTNEYERLMKLPVEGAKRSRIVESRGVLAVMLAARYRAMGDEPKALEYVRASEQHRKQLDEWRTWWGM